MNVKWQKFLKFDEDNLKIKLQNKTITFGYLLFNKVKTIEGAQLKKDKSLASNNRFGGLPKVYCQ